MYHVVIRHVNVLCTSYYHAELRENYTLVIIIYVCTLVIILHCVYYCSHNNLTVKCMSSNMNVQCIIIVVRYMIDMPQRVYRGVGIL